MKEGGKGEKLKISTQQLTIAYIILVCLGYLEKASFYDRFDLEVTNYLSFEEYLLFFLPIGSSAIIFIVGFFGYFIIMFAASDALRVPFLPKNVPEVHKTSEKKYVQSVMKSRLANHRIWYILRNIIFVILVFLPISLILMYMLGVLKRFDIAEPIIVFWSWSLILLALLTTKGRAERVPMTLAAGGFIVFLVTIGRGNIKDRAEKILNGNPKYLAIVEYEDKRLESNESIVYIDQTSNYLFFRDLKNDGNIVLSKKDVSQYIIRPNDETHEK